MMLLNLYYKEYIMAKLSIAGWVYSSEVNGDWATLKIGKVGGNGYEIKYHVPSIERVQEMAGIWASLLAVRKIMAQPWKFKTVLATAALFRAAVSCIRFKAKYNQNPKFYATLGIEINKVKNFALA